MPITKHIQARLEIDLYDALHRWAQTHNTSLTDAVSRAVRALTGLSEQPTKSPESMMGLLADTDVMEEMENERVAELARDQRWR